MARSIFRAILLSLAFVFAGATLGQHVAPASASPLVNIDVWPALGTTVTLQDGITTITASGAVLTYTTEISALITRGKLITHNPDPNGTSFVDYPTSQIDSGAPVSVVMLATRAGTYQGQTIFANYYDTGKPLGGGAFYWDGASTSTRDNCVIYGNTTVGRWRRVGPVDYIDASWCGLYNDAGASDQWATMQTAVTLALTTGVPVHVPPGTYKFGTTITARSGSFSGAYGTGIRLLGSGMAATVFQTAVGNAPLFDVDVDDDSDHTPFFAMQGVEFKDFKIVKASGTVAGATGIKLRTAFQVEIQRVHIDLAGSSGAVGIEIADTLGDVDGSNMVNISRTRIENCGGWGIKSDTAVSHNEISFLKLDHVFIASCGTTSASTPPPSGGFIWKGQILTMTSCAFTTNINVALYVKGAEAGLALNVDISDTTFENNTKRYVYVTGINQFRANNVRINGSNGAFVATSGFEFDGSAANSMIRGVDIDHAIIRSGNQNTGFVAFLASGTTASGGNMEMDRVRARNISFDAFNDSTMTRFSSGWFFDPVPFTAQLVLVNNSIVRLEPSVNAWGKGGTFPYMISNGASTSGEVIMRTVMSSSPLAAAPANTTLEGVAASTLTSQRLYMYVYDNAGAPALKHSTVAPTFDTVLGYYVKTSDRAKTYAGSVLMDGSGNYDVTQNGYLDPLLVPGTKAGTPAQVWLDASNVPRFKMTAPANDNDGSTFDGSAELTGSATLDPGSIAAGAMDTIRTVTISGVALGDHVAESSFSTDTNGLILNAWVSTTNTVAYAFFNPTTGPLNPPLGTYKFRVRHQ